MKKTIALTDSQKIRVLLQVRNTLNLRVQKRTIEDQLAAAPQAMSNLANQIVAEHGLSGQVDFDVDNLQLTADVPEPIVLPPAPPVEPPSAELIPDVPAIALPEPLTTVAPVAAAAEQDIPF